MGEYAIHTQTKVEVKLGTCEDMMYVRREELAMFRKVPNSADPRYLAQEDVVGGLFFRFPWPQEDGDGIGKIGQRDPDAPRDWAGALLLCPTDNDPHGVHNAIRVHGYHDEKQPQMRKFKFDHFSSMVVPCPATIPGRMTLVQPVRMRFNPIRTVFRCPWCSGQFAMSPEEVAVIREVNADNPLNYDDVESLNKVLERLKGREG